MNDKSSYNANPTTSTADNGDTHALIADMAFGVAITFGVTSAVLFLTKDEAPPAAAARGEPYGANGREGRRRSKNQDHLRTPIVGPHEGGAGVLMRF